MIYLAATIGYGLGSDDPEEVAFYNKIREEMKDDKKNGNMGIDREDWWWCYEYGVFNIECNTGKTKRNYGQ